MVHEIFFGRTELGHAIFTELKYMLQFNGGT